MMLSCQWELLYYYKYITSITYFNNNNYILCNTDGFSFVHSPILSLSLSLSTIDTSVFGLVIVVVVFGYLLSIFRLKYDGYPYRYVN